MSMTTPANAPRCGRCQTTHLDAIGCPATPAQHTPGPWDMACDSYGKVRHSQKYDCVFATIKVNNAERLVTVAARIENPADARLIAQAPRMLEIIRKLLNTCELNLDDMELATLQTIKEAHDAIRDL